MGDLEYISAWETSTTTIFLNLKGENGEVRLTVTYRSKEWASKISEEEAKSEF